MPRRTKEAALETRDRILDAAERIFQDRGVSNTSLAEIAGAAGVTRGAIYWHFDNKVALFDALLQRVFGPLEAKLAELQAGAGADPVEMLRAIALHFIDRASHDPSYTRVLEIAWHKCEYVGEMAAIRDAHLECGNRYLDLLADGFRQARRAGLLPDSTDPRQAAIGLMALVDGLVVNWTLDHGLFDLDRVGPAVIDSFLAGIRIPK